jgi:hypothetical protein
VTASSTGSNAPSIASIRRKTRIPAASAVRLALRAVLGFFRRPSGSPRKMVAPAIPPSSTICAVDSVQALPVVVRHTLQAPGL